MPHKDKSINVLLIDNEPEHVELTRRILCEGQDSYRVTVMNDCRSTIGYLRQQLRSNVGVLPNLILLELDLPEDGGIEILREIKGDASLRNIPVIVLTRSNSQKDIDDAYDLHVNCCLKKPDNDEGFIQTIQTIKDFWITKTLLPKRENVQGG